MSGSPFSAYLGLASNLLDRRDVIVERLESRVLNVKGKPLARQRDLRHLSQAIDGCVFAAPGVSSGAARLRDDLLASQLTDGFEPLYPETYVWPLDPAMLVLRAYEYWDAHRWPGASARVAFAQSLYAAVVLRLLQAMTLRMWDDAAEDVDARVRHLQHLLDTLNASAAGVRLIRDARWLLQTAQGTITKHLAPYFRVAARIADSFDGEAAEAVHAAGVMLAGGHLRSQLRHRAAELHQPPHSPDVLTTTRNSNALDVALLVWDLVALLEGYTAAVGRGDRESRARLAFAIFQGWSADPELLLTRLDLLTPYSMIETLFLDVGEAGRRDYSDTGRRHLRVLERYARLVDDTAAPMLEDAQSMDPDDGAYSPLGFAYGFCADLLAQLALEPLHGRLAHSVSLQDLFVTPSPGELRARVDAWASPGSDRPQGLEYAPHWAHEVFARTREAIAARASGRGRANASDVRTAALIVAAEAPAEPAASAQEHVVISDIRLAMAIGASAFPRPQFVADRNEARFLASAEVNGRWFGISKVVLTLRLAAGEDALVGGVPDDVSEILRLTCPGLVRWDGEPR